MIPHMTLPTTTAAVAPPTTLITFSSLRRRLARPSSISDPASCSATACTTFSSCSPHERQNRCSAEFVFPQLGQYMFVSRLQAGVADPVLLVRAPRPPGFTVLALGPAGGLPFGRR